VKAHRWGEQARLQSEGARPRPRWRAVAKWGGGCLLLLWPLTLGGLSQQSQQPPEAQQPQPQQPQQRPTLGPPPEGSPEGPRTSTTTDARKLRRIRALYVERIDNSLSDRLIEGLTKIGRFRLVPKANEADATLRGSCLESRRLKRVHSEVFINDRGGASVWQDTIMRPYNPPTLAKAVDETAQVVVNHLEESLREAEGK